jgi:hypothetical protein
MVILLVSQGMMHCMYDQCQWERASAAGILWITECVIDACLGMVILLVSQGMMHACMINASGNGSVQLVFYGSLSL